MTGGIRQSIDAFGAAIYQSSFFLNNKNQFFTGVKSLIIWDQDRAKSLADCFDFNGRLGQDKAGDWQ